MKFTTIIEEKLDVTKNERSISLTISGKRFYKEKRITFIFLNTKERTLVKYKENYEVFAKMLLSKEFSSLENEQSFTVGNINYYTKVLNNFLKYIENNKIVSLKTLFILLHYSCIKNNFDFLNTICKNRYFLSLALKNKEKYTKVFAYNLSSLRHLSNEDTELFFYWIINNNDEVSLKEFSKKPKEEILDQYFKTKNIVIEDGFSIGFYLSSILIILFKEYSLKDFKKIIFLRTYKNIVKSNNSDVLEFYLKNKDLTFKEDSLYWKYMTFEEMKECAHLKSIDSNRSHFKENRFLITLENIILYKYLLQFYAEDKIREIFFLFSEVDPNDEVREIDYHSIVKLSKRREFDTIPLGVAKTLL